MPQLDTSNFISQIFWLIITFASLYFYLQRYVLPKLGGIILQRAITIENDLKQANALKDEILSLNKLIEAEIHLTNEKITIMHKDALAKIHSAKQSSLDKISGDFADRQQLIIAEIEKSKRDALNHMQSYVIDYTEFLLEKIIGSKPKTNLLNQYYLRLEEKS